MTKTLKLITSMSKGSYTVKYVAQLIRENGFIPCVYYVGRSSATLCAKDSNLHVIAESNLCSVAYVLSVYNKIK